MLVKFFNPSVPTIKKPVSGFVLNSINWFSWTIFTALVFILRTIWDSLDVAWVNS